MLEQTSSETAPTIAIIMAVHNRADTTLGCLRRIASSTIPVPPKNIFIVDDGSTDGTRALVLSEFPEVNVIEGDGNLFWGRSMALAEKCAVSQGAELLLWLNDDIDMYPTAVERLVKTCISGELESRPIVTGALQSPLDDSTSYSGYRIRRKFGFLRLARVDPNKSLPQEVDTFNGNIVLVPIEHSLRLRGIDDTFTHHYGDLDFGLRASKVGIKNILVSDYVGRTARNSPTGTFRDRSAPRRLRFDNLFGPKGFPPMEKFHYLRRHGGYLWLLQWASFYSYWVARIVTRL